MRTAELTRETKETKISASLSLDGGVVEIETGVGFFDHMLNTFAVHGGFGLKIQVGGDLQVDAHHTVEDSGIVLGKLFNKAVGGTANITRYGSFFIPMDEALAFASVDVSGRPFLVFDASFKEERTGAFETCLCEEFFRAFAMQAGVTLHIKLIYGENAHHMLEAIFKAVAHAIRIAVKEEETAVLSTKGILE